MVESIFSFRLEEAIVDFLDDQLKTTSQIKGLKPKYRSDRADWTGRIGRPVPWSILGRLA
jgi:hypothetical protein